MVKFIKKDFVEVKDSNHGIYRAHIYLDGELPSDVYYLSRKDIIEHLQANKTRMQLIFLGTASGIPTKSRSLGCTVFRTQADIWLFDIGNINYQIKIKIKLN